MPRQQRQALYKRLTQLSYTCNDDKLRLASLFIRNKVMQDTRGESNEIEEDRLIQKAKPSDFLPDTMKDVAAS